MQTFRSQNIALCYDSIITKRLQRIDCNEKVFVFLVHSLFIAHAH